MYGQAPLKDDEYVLERRITAFKWTMMVHHVLSFILALATFCVCIWIRFDLDFWEWVIEIDWYSYWYAVYVIMITMVIVVINNLIGAYGIIWERTGLILTNSILLGISFILQLIGAIVICVYGVEESPILVNELNEVFIKLVYRWDYDPRASRILKQIFEYVGCCGADGSDDFINAMKPVPFECRDMITGSEYAFGCQQQLAWWLEPWTATLAGICVFYLVADVFGIIINRKLRQALALVVDY